MKRILFICGSLNQTTQMHKISRYLSCHDCWFTPYYGDGFIRRMTSYGLLDFTALGGKFRKQTEEYLNNAGCRIDLGGERNNYDLVLTCQDLLVQKNIRNKKIVLIQEGMTDPENFMFYMSKWFGLPRYLASTSTTGLSDKYHKFCVASEGYRELFIRKGVRPEKIAVTGIPNFDNLQEYCNNDFPYGNYVFVATSDTRETFKFDNRKKFLKRALEIAAGRPLIFKLHPNENSKRSTAEIKNFAPDAMVLTDGNAHHMVANCEVLITQYSSLAFTGIALGKEVHSYFDVEMLRRLLPLQNGGTSAQKIAGECRGYLE